MKTIMHADNWVEIPAGECLLGISDEQAMHIWRQMYDRGNYANLSEADKQRIAEIIDLLRNNRYTVAAHEDAKRLFGTWVIPRFAYIPQRRVWLDRFYIARYPITGKQLAAYLGKKVAAQALPDPLEPSQASNGKIYRPDVMSISDTTLALRLCDALGGRLPTADEWEKAARGTDGRLMPASGGGICAGAAVSGSASGIIVRLGATLTRLKGRSQALRTRQKSMKHKAKTIF